MVNTEEFYAPREGALDQSFVTYTGDAGLYGPSQNEAKQPSSNVAPMQASLPSMRPPLTPAGGHTCTGSMQHTHIYK